MTTMGAGAGTWIWNCCPGATPGGTCTCMFCPLALITMFVPGPAPSGHCTIICWRFCIPTGCADRDARYRQTERRGALLVQDRETARRSALQVCLVLAPGPVSTFRARVSSSRRRGRTCMGGCSVPRQDRGPWEVCQGWLQPAGPRALGCCDGGCCTPPVTTHVTTQHASLTTRAPFAQMDRISLATKQPILWQGRDCLWAMPGAR